MCNAFLLVRGIKMKKKIGLILLFVLLLSLNISAYGLSIEYVNADGRTEKLNDFLDTQGHWAHDTILKWAEFDLINGYNGNFMPNNNITRGDLAIVLDRMLGLKTVSYNFFNDLSNDAYYRDSVLKCVAAGYITGTGPNTIDPKGYATREQVAVIICRMFNIDTSYVGATGFADDLSISDWARPSVGAMRRLGYMVGGGDNRFNPKSNITRAEMIQVLSNIANTYIPKKDTTGQGTSFKSNFSSNVVVGRYIELISSTIGRDLILTQTATSVSLNKTTIMGRILVLGKSSITLANTKVSQIYLGEGKSSIYGITDGVREVYVSEYASESTLDAIPEKLVLESGVRVKVDGVMYENESTRTKVYYGDNLKAAIADEQGYVVGGPKISGVKFAQKENNVISVSNVKITSGDSKVKEVGVIWLNQADTEDTKNPTCQNYDGKKVYNSGKIGEPLEFTVGTVSGTRAYRVYVKDSDGLYAYSSTTIFTEYDYNTSLKIYDNDYPEKVDVEVVFMGDNIPEIRSVRVVYDITELYSEVHDEITLRLYSDPDAEYQPDENKYKRYVATIRSDGERDSVSGEYRYTPPTAFGYIITFKDGSIINKFPVVVNAVPEGVSPMATLATGKARYTLDGKIVIDNSFIATRYAIPQEVGIVYKAADEESVSRPTAEANGWRRIQASVSLGVNDTAYFNSTIIPNIAYENTFYAAYVKTSNGYWYGEIHKVSNDFIGDENGHRLLNANVTIMGDSDAIVSIQFEGKVPSLEDTICLGDDLGVSSFKDLEGVINGRMVYFVLRDLDDSTLYNIPLRVINQSGDKSNVIPLVIETKDKVDLGFVSKSESNGYSVFTLGSNEIDNSKLKIVSGKVLNSNEVVFCEGENKLLISSAAEVDDLEVVVEFTYFVSRNVTNSIGWRFERILKLY